MNAPAARQIMAKVRVFWLSCWQCFEEEKKTLNALFVHGVILKQKLPSKASSSKVGWTTHLHALG
jgi:hypothetical protein